MNPNWIFWFKIKHLSQVPYLVPTVNYGGGTVMLWGSFYSQRTEVMNRPKFWPKTLHYIRITSDEKNSPVIFDGAAN